jgi:hypothetical protein
LFVPNDLLPTDPHHVPVPQGGVHLIVVCLFDDRDAMPEDSHTVAGLEPPLLPAAGIPPMAALD